jgi:hypothetical protein
MSTLDMADHGVRSIIGRENKKYKNAWVGSVRTNYKRVTRPEQMRKLMAVEYERRQLASLVAFCILGFPNNWKSWGGGWRCNIIFCFKMLKPLKMNINVNLFYGTAVPWGSGEEWSGWRAHLWWKLLVDVLQDSRTMKSQSHAFWWATMGSGSIPKKGSLGV